MVLEAEEGAGEVGDEGAEGREGELRARVAVLDVEVLEGTSPVR